MICATFLAFRARFAVRAILPLGGGQTLTFVAPDQINRSVGTWPGDTPAWVAGMTMVVVGSAAGNDTFTVESVLGAALTTVETTVVNEGPIAPANCDGVTFDNSGFEVWPVALMRAGGPAFDDGISGFNTVPYVNATLTLTAETGGSDAVYNTDEYDWYLSQRTDTPGIQYLSIIKGADTAGPVSHSEEVQLAPTAFAATKFGFTLGDGLPLDPNIVRMLFNHCDLYVRRISDGAIQRVDLLEAIMAVS